MMAIVFHAKVIYFWNITKLFQKNLVYLHSNNKESVMIKNSLFIAILLFSATALMARQQTVTGSWSAVSHQPLLEVTAWKGERVGVMGWLKCTSATTETQPFTLCLKSNRQGKNLLAAHSVNSFIRSTVGFVDSVLTDDFKACGKHPEHLPPYPVPDVIVPDTAVTLKPGQQVPFWCTIEVPHNMQPGCYSVWVEAWGGSHQKRETRLEIRLNVLNRSLPQTGQGTFHVDFWQQPYAVSRYHGVERWSQQHFNLLRPYLELLARGGQRVATAILFYEPWGDQSNDKFSPMIKTLHHRDGSWSYDYTIFDHWIELCDSCGINGQINCYSMIPWDMSFQYEEENDEGTHTVTLATNTNTEDYARLWVPFLRSFAAHLKEKGWFKKTCIAMDERGLHAMLDAYRLLHATVPDMKMALAGNRHTELVDKLYDYSLALSQRFTEDELAQRREQHMVSTVYSCCADEFPGLFTNSHPVEATLLPLYATACGFDGYLHWSWMNWNDHPLTDSRFRLFPPGDTYVIYPGPRSSLRWEHFIKGVQLVEKAKLLGIDLTPFKEYITKHPRQQLAEDVHALEEKTATAAE